MRPSNEAAALRLLPFYHLKLNGDVISSPRDGDDLSIGAADLVAFLCEEHGYRFSSSPKRKGIEKREFIGWFEAEYLLCTIGFRYAKRGEKFVIVPPDHIDMNSHNQKRGWIRDTVDYLIDEWNYEV